MSYCTQHPDYCKNGGVCRDTGADSANCFCYSNYAGARCQSEHVIFEMARGIPAVYDVCSATNCSSRGTCSQNATLHLVKMQCACEQYYSVSDYYFCLEEFQSDARV